MVLEDSKRRDKNCDDRQDNDEHILGCFQLCCCFRDNAPLDLERDEYLAAHEEAAEPPDKRPDGKGDPTEFDPSCGAAGTPADEGDHGKEQERDAGPGVQVCDLEAGRRDRGDRHEQRLFKCPGKTKIPKKHQVVRQDRNTDPEKDKKEFDLFIAKEAEAAVFKDQIIELEREGAGNHHGYKQELQKKTVVIEDPLLVYTEPAAGDGCKGKVDRFPKRQSREQDKADRHEG